MSTLVHFLHSSHLREELQIDSRTTPSNLKHIGFDLFSFPIGTFIAVSDCAEPLKER